MSAPINPAAFVGAELVSLTPYRSTSEIDLAIALAQEEPCGALPAGSGFAAGIVLGSAFWFALAGWVWSLP